MLRESERDANILALATSVRAIARSIARGLPRHVRLDDLISEGWIGAIYAVDHWRPEVGCLPRYAKFRIRGAILDYLRRIDFLSRDHRREQREAEEGGAAPIQLFSIEGGKRVDAGDGNPINGDPLERNPQLGRTDRAFAVLEARDELAHIMRRSVPLTAKEESVLRRYDGEGENMKAIGRSMGIGESRTSQIRQSALRKLRQAA